MQLTAKEEPGQAIFGIVHDLPEAARGYAALDIKKHRRAEGMRSSDQEIAVGYSYA